jgi:hypothetical protein
MTNLSLNLLKHSNRERDTAPFSMDGAWHLDWIRSLGEVIRIEYKVIEPGSPPGTRLARGGRFNITLFGYCQGLVIVLLSQGHQF